MSSLPRSLLLLFTLLLLLFLREGILHEELSIGWVPPVFVLGSIRERTSWVRLILTLVLVWHKNGSLECFHQWDTDVFLFVLSA